MIVVLLRHGERDGNGTDALSAAGKKRAVLLATMFAKAGVSAIFTSEFNRTKQMAAPLASKLGITPRPLPSALAAAKTLILASGPCAVVIGHSDTVPALIQRLGGPGGVVIADNEFDRLFVVAITPAQTLFLPMTYVSV